MITNREEVLEKAFKVFVKMNYEKASFTEIAKACGLSRAGIIHYFPYKLDLFVAVVDKFVFQIHHPNNKFDVKECTLKDFIELYLKGVTATMKRLVELIDDGTIIMILVPIFTIFTSSHRSGCTIPISGNRYPSFMNKIIICGLPLYNKQKIVEKYVLIQM